MRTTAAAGQALLAGLALLIGGAAAPPTSPFDGSWRVLVTCEPASGAQRYRLDFLAKVQGGALLGQHGSPGLPDWLGLSGQIAPDGSAMLLANGLTGNAAYAVGQLRPATPYTYHVSAQFGPATGQGRRLELRACGYQFTRQ